ncbi:MULTISPECIES: glycine C-acetyltransferase [Kytococcus]|uniref:2-amino-3-ketobutyrate coenzyme A ligase n=1 Tax=Kytococcus schroeteri TaxID=138300 RepID=A0A2I1P9E0_9MICO|nr:MULTISPECIES: glycine C-acetyltransferase [Kytococcus]OFS16082.1 glycine C-acetyltransferase [Kytococcus sp. HMSC28H12]PKZ41230.1 glycine C-acetyltransferase [Kytococcus schroeteri]
MYAFKDQLTSELTEIKDAGLWKDERELTSPQSAHVTTKKAEALNFCANNYLGLADHPEVEAAAKSALDEWGFGMASVRFICGTQTLHTELEQRIAAFVGCEDAILYASCFDANGGFFEVLFGKEDAIVSDALNHASIIDGVRLSKAMRYRYANRDMDDLRTQLQAAKDAGARRTVIVTDGVFSMDGYYAPLEEICDLAEEFGAMVVVDDSHATGFTGEKGRGTAEKFDVIDRVDVVTGTFGKALGGASGGFVAGPKEVVALLKQRSRPYLFSNAVAPSTAAGSLKALELVESSDELRAQLERNAKLFRELMTEAGFELLEGSHPIIPVMFPGEDGARQAGQVAEAMLERGVYVIPFSYPVVPKGEARIRVQLSAAHSEEDVRACVQAFVDSREAVAGA